MEYSFHVFNKLAADGVALSTHKLLTNFEGAGTRRTLNPAALPVVVCVGSDLAVGDSLGPLVGSMLKFKTQGLGAFIYGSLSSPITAKEVKYLAKFLKRTHADRQIIAVDAAVGEQGDVGLIKVLDCPLRPGAGASKELPKIGDLTVMGVVAEKSLGNYALLHATRLRLVYKMATEISDALASVLWERKNNRQVSLTRVEPQ